MKELEQNPELRARVQELAANACQRAGGDSWERAAHWLAIGYIKLADEGKGDAPAVNVGLHFDGGEGQAQGQAH